VAVGGHLVELSTPGHVLTIMIKASEEGWISEEVVEVIEEALE
jgi:hypothetical protein